MSKLELHFSGSNFELYKTVFEHHILKYKATSIRGKTLGATNASGTFQWTPAVKALCILSLQFLLNHKFNYQINNEVINSLDYAYDKETVWLKEMFGLNLNNEPIYKKVFKRTNPGRRHAGNCEITFNLSFLDNFEIIIYLNNKKIDNLTELERIFEYLSKNWKTYNLSNPEDPSKNWQTIIKKSLKLEILEGLRLTNIFKKDVYQEQIKKLNKFVFLRKVLGKKNFSFFDEQLNQDNLFRLGLVNTNNIRTLNSIPEISLAVSGTLASAYAIIRQLQKTTLPNLKINNNFPHAVEIARQVIKDNFFNLPDLLVLGSAPAASILASKYGEQYYPLTFLPKVSHSILAGKKRKTINININQGKFHFISDDPSLPGVIFEELLEQNLLSLNKLDISNLEPDETFAALKNGDDRDRAILFFPHNILNINFNNCTSISLGNNDLIYQDVILLAKKSSFTPEQAKSLCLLIRDTWLKVLINEDQRISMINDICDQQNYIDFLGRVGGIHLL